VQRKRVLLDCDGVLSDCVKGMAVEAEKIFGLKAPNPRKHWDLCTDLNLTKEQEGQMWRAMSQLGWADHLEVLPGAKEGVRELQKIADVYIVTAPVYSSPTWVHDRYAWLRREFKIDHKHVVITHAKYLCRGDVFVDDKPVTVENWVHHHPDNHGLVWNYSYTEDDHPHLPRAFNWADVIERAEKG
jgi:5'(3')-deoxyribonucleotidase